MGETGTRVAVAAVGIPVAAAAVYLGGWFLAGLLMLVGVLAALEFFRMAERKDVRPLRSIGAGGSAAFVLLAAALPGAAGADARFFLAALVVLLSAVVVIWVRGVEGQPLLAASVTVFGALYTGGLLSFALPLRHLPYVESALHGTALLFVPLVLTWASDTFAYFTGRQWGRRKLIPRVSPGKTVEGSVGALVGTVLAAVGYSFVLKSFPTYRIGILGALLLGVLISVAAQVGDLAESLLKRDAGVKDSGTLLPGHGGALDRFDSLFFTLPLAYFFFRYFVGPF